jgi:hypothetical protein
MANEISKRWPCEIETVLIRPERHRHTFNETERLSVRRLAVLAIEDPSVARRALAIGTLKRLGRRTTAMDILDPDPVVRAGIPKANDSGNVQSVFCDSSNARPMLTEG